MKLKSHLYCLLTICIWSTLELAGKLLGREISPFTITAWRFLIGGSVILPFAIRQWRRDHIDLNIGSILKIGALGILNVVISMLLLQFAIHYGKASLTAMIVSMNPLFVSLFAIFLLKEKLSKIQIISLGIGILGLIIIIMGDNDKLSKDFLNLPLGVFFAVLAAICFALYTVLAKWSVGKHGNLITNSLSFLIGGVVLSILNLILGKTMLFPATFNNISIMLYLGVMISGLAYLLYFEAMKHLSAAKASIWFFLKPALASLLAYFILGESLSAWQIAGMILIMLALSRNLFIKSV